MNENEHQTETYEYFWFRPRFLSILLGLSLYNILHELIRFINSDAAPASDIVYAFIINCPLVLWWIYGMWRIERNRRLSGNQSN